MQHPSGSPTASLVKLLANLNKPDRPENLSLLREHLPRPPEARFTLGETRGQIQ